MSVGTCFFNRFVRYVKNMRTLKEKKVNFETNEIAKEIE